MKDSGRWKRSLAALSLAALVSSDTHLENVFAYCESNSSFSKSVQAEELFDRIMSGKDRDTKVAHERSYSKNCTYQYEVDKRSTWHTAYIKRCIVEVSARESNQNGLHGSFSAQIVARKYLPGLSKSISLKLNVDDGVTSRVYDVRATGNPNRKMQLDSMIAHIPYSDLRFKSGANQRGQYETIWLAVDFRGNPGHKSSILDSVASAEERTQASLRAIDEMFGTTPLKTDKEPPSAGNINCYSTLKPYAVAFGMLEKTIPIPGEQVIPAGYHNKILSPENFRP